MLHTGAVAREYHALGFCIPFPAESRSFASHLLEYANPSLSRLTPNVRLTRPRPHPRRDKPPNASPTRDRCRLPREFCLVTLTCGTLQRAGCTHVIASR